MVPICCQIIVISILRAALSYQLGINHDITPSVPDLFFKLLLLEFLWHNDWHTFLTRLQISSFTCHCNIFVERMEALCSLTPLKVMVQSLIPVLGRMFCHVIFIYKIIVNFASDQSLVFFFQIFADLILLGHVLFVPRVSVIILLLRYELNSHFINFVFL